MSSSAVELNRLQNGVSKDELPNGLLSKYVLDCRPGSEETLRKIREVWGIVLSQPNPGSLTLDEWKQALPMWFLEKCGEEITMQEALRRRLLPIEERARLGEIWTLGAWVHWLQPSERQWEWWDAEVKSHQILWVRILVQGMPFASESLLWLFKCAGAIRIDVL